MFLFSFGTVAVLAAAVLWLGGIFRLRLYVVVAYLWLLISAELFSPTTAGSAWWRRFRVVQVVGGLVVAVFVYQKVVAVLT